MALAQSQAAMTLKCGECEQDIVAYRMTYICRAGHETKEIIDPPTGNVKHEVIEPQLKGTKMSLPPSGSQMVMPFGKHRGEKISDLPSDYIEWCLENLENIRPDLQKEMENQLELRKGHGIDR